MAQLRDYLVHESIHQDHRTHVYRASRADSGERVIIKQLGGDRPLPRERARLRREYALGRRLADLGVQGIVRPTNLDERLDPPLLVMEDRGGETLAHRLARGRPDLVEALHLGHGIAAALAELHASAVVHKDIKPSNVLIAEDGRVCLFDFGIAATVTRETTASAVAPERLEGTLPYMAPEQTGRVGRAVDARSDLYALGVVLFEILTGHVPFRDVDPMALVHAHIARRPPAVKSLAPNVPTVVDDLVQRLLEKAAENRYQTATGVADDLDRCLLALRENATLSPFVLGRSDLPDRLEAPKRLYGRDLDVARLVDAFEVAAEGQSGLALVYGYSGIGKTSLVDEIQGRVVERGGRFVRGKFDQFKRGIPYASVVQAFQALVASLANESDWVRASWQARISNVLGGLGGVVTDVIPELTDLIGPQPEAPELEPESARLRFMRTMLSFVGALSTRESPLVLFLDDLQWADQGSLDLLHALVTQRGRSQLLVVGAYRDNEVDATHPLSIELERTRKARQVQGLRPVLQLEVAPLTLTHLTQLLADTVHRDDEAVAPLAQLVLDKTGGNPFFLHEFLRTIHRKGLVRLVHGVGFVWELDAIRRASTTENVAELLLDRIRLVPTRAQLALKYSACLGAEFDFETLFQVMSVTDDSRADLADDVATLTLDGLIVPLDENYGLMGVTDERSIEARYQFQHDRVQQSAYAMWSESERPQIHVDIAAHLRRALEPAQLEERSFEVADHLLRGVDALAQPEARVDAAALLCAAGERAKHAAAYGPALRYLQIARALLADAVYVTPAVDGVTLVSMMAQCEYLLGRADVADTLFEEVFAHARTNQERAQSLVVRVQLHVSRGSILSALDLAVKGLALCGEILDLAPTPEAVGAGFEDLGAAIAGRSFEVLAELPEPSDPLKVAALEILNDTAAPAYFVNENLYASIILKMCSISARHGQSPVSPFGWALYGVVAGAILGDFETSKATARTARRVQARFNRIQMVPKLRLCLEGYVDPWTRPPLDGIAGLVEGTRVGLDAGDPVFATFSSMAMGYLWLQTGMELEELVQESSRWGAFIRGLGVAECAEAHEVNLRLAQSLREEVVCGPVELGEDEGAFLSRLESFTLRIPYHMAVLAKMELALVMNALDTGVALIDLSSQLEPRSIGTGYSTQHAWLTALLLVRMMERGPHEATAERRAVVEAQLARLRAWAVANPFAHQHKVDGIEAALHALDGRLGEALEKFERAVVDAEHSGYVKNAALLAEQAASVHLRLGQQRLWLFYLRDARALYERWGALRKVRALDVAYPHLGQERSSQAPATSNTQTRTIERGTHSTSASPSNAELDALSIIRASQAISGEIILEKLADRLLDILLQSGGAQRALFFVVEHGALRPMGARRSDELAESPEDEARDVCSGALNYALRQRSVALIDDTADAGIFANDPYIRAGKTHSILALPVVSQGVVKGLVYLENGLTRGAFTADRIGMLEVLAAQLAISIENALLYRNLERQASAFARFVPREFLQLLDKGSVDDIQLGDAVRRNMAVMFTDIRAYTSISEAMSPEDNFAFVNAYMSRMGPAVRQHGGFIDKYIGDAIMALFPRSPDDALAAAVEMQRRLVRLNEEREALGDEPVGAGIGLHFGSVMLGIVGEAERLDGTVISDVVNTASRIEGLCKFLGAPLLVSEAILSTCSEPEVYPHRYLGSVAVAGKRERLRVFEVFGAEAPRAMALKVASRAEFEQGVAALEQEDFVVAVRHFEAVLRRDPSDEPARLHLERASSRDGRMTAPPKG